MHSDIAIAGVMADRRVTGDRETALRRNDSV